MIGKNISQYRIIKRIKEGGMGIIYKAVDLKLKRYVALKFMPARWYNNRLHIERFKLEAISASAIHHPNVCTIYKLIEMNSNPIIVMEYVEGENLYDKIKNCPLKIEDVIDYAVQISEALMAAHRIGIIHRDIKPENIMVTPDNLVKVMDFGFAIKINSAKNNRRIESMGTITYMSLEQIMGEKIDTRTDIWSLGILLYEILVGKLHFDGIYNPEIAYSIVNLNPKPLSKLRSDIPIELESIIYKTLYKEPNLHYSHIEELWIDLKLLQCRQYKLNISKSVIKKKGKSFLSNRPAVNFSNKNQNIIDYNIMKMQRMN